MERTILHIDFDSFFASVEQQRNPYLRNRPVGVTATNGRTCIIAASREAKRNGVKSPSLTFDAQKICPRIIFVPAHFVEYWKITKQFIALCNTFSPTVEVFSLDEVFMDVTQTAKLFGGMYPLINQFKQKLSATVGACITASVGIAPNKLLAKLASGLQKPNGVMEITNENFLQVYTNTKLTDICGIGYRIEKRLIQMGIADLIKLHHAPLPTLIAEFGNVEGQFLYNVGQGIDDRPLIPHELRPDVKSVGRQYCLPHNEYNSRRVLQNLYELCEEVTFKLRSLNKKARHIGFYLSGERAYGGRKTYTTYINTGRELYDGCCGLLQESEQLSAAAIQKYNFLQGYIRHISVWVSYLENNENLPASIFPSDQRYERVVHVMDALNERFGDHTVRNGFFLYADKLTTVPNGFTVNRYTD